MKKSKKVLKNCRLCQKRYKASRISSTYCSVKCKWSYEKKNKLRSIKRNEMKLELIRLKGGECDICGYKKNYAALCFHHVDPKKKLVGMNVGMFSEKNRTKIFREAKKCQLLCCNCHAEVHNQTFLL